MKKIKLFLLSILAMVLFIPRVSAASASANVSGTSQAVVGNKVNITVTLSSNSGIGSWQMNLNYDKSYLQLTSSSAEAGGTMMAGYASGNDGTKKKTYNFTFKTLKTGSTKVSITSALVYGADMNQMTLSQGSKNIKIITQKELEASYSKNNDLKSLEVEGFEITPVFNKETLSYNAIVPENTKEINIKATPADSRSSINGAGTKEVTSGANTFEIVVRAQNGAQKTYTLNVEVKDNNPINVTVDGKNFTVVKIKEFMPVSTYQETTVKIGEFDIPAYYNETIKKTLVGLKDIAGNISLNIYENGKYEKYNELNLNAVSIYPLKANKELVGYEQGNITIGALTIPAYYLNKDSRFAIIYGINLNNGEEGFYKVDKKNNTAILYDEEIDNLRLDYEKKATLYSYIIIGFSVILIIMFLLLITKGRKKKRKNNLEVEEEIETFDENKNTIEEIKEEEKSEEEFVEEKPKKKKKKKGAKDDFQD